MSALALRITEAEEAFADTALLNLSRLRDSVRHRGFHHIADQIDDAIHAVEAASREMKA